LSSLISNAREKIPYAGESSGALPRVDVNEEPPHRKILCGKNVGRFVRDSS